MLAAAATAPHPAPGGAGGDALSGGPQAAQRRAQRCAPSIAPAPAAARQQHQLWAAPRAALQGHSGLWTAGLPDALFSRRVSAAGAGVGAAALLLPSAHAPPAAPVTLGPAWAAGAGSVGKPGLLGGLDGGTASVTWLLGGHPSSATNPGSAQSAASAMSALVGAGAGSPTICGGGGASGVPAPGLDCALLAAARPGAGTLTALGGYGALSLSLQPAVALLQQSHLMDAMTPPEAAAAAIDGHQLEQQGPWLGFGMAPMHELAQRFRI
jgi:hypothetical protein